MSKAFAREVNLTDKVCTKHVNGPCGWGVDSDEYLDTQEIDPLLNYANSGIAISEAKPGTVQVKLNVYPSEKDASGYYLRTITYQMTREGGAWVLDDIVYTNGISARKQMADDRKNALAYPDK